MISNLNVVERIQRHRHTQRYQQQLNALLQNELLLRLFPGLHKLPLALSYPDATPCAIDTALLNRPRILLCAEHGIDAHLVFIQLAARWSEQPSTTAALPFPIDLTAIDQAHASPIACLTSLLWSQETIGQTSRLQLLISGWAGLTSARREAWKAALCQALPERVVQVLVIVPAQERLWQGYAPILVGQPDLALQARWASMLATKQLNAEHIMAHMRPTDRLFTTLMHILALRNTEPYTPLRRAAAVEAGLGLLRAEAQQGTALPADSSLSFGTQAEVAREERRIQQAQVLAKNGPLTTLLAFSASERHELALLLNSMLPDAQPLLQTLWRQRQSDAMLQTVASCLVEAQSASPGWALLICRTLGERIREHAAESAQLEQALNSCLPALDAALSQLAARPRPLRRLISSTLQALPEAIAQPRLAWLAYTDGLHAALAWDAAEALIHAAQLGGQTSTFAPEQPEVLARWAYVQALAGPAARLRLIPLAERALAALATLPTARRLRVAQLLLADTELPQIIRLAAIELLRGCPAADSVPLLLGMSRDTSGMIRAAAIQALERHDPEQAQDMLLSRLADPMATEAQQLEALRALLHLREKGLPLIEQLLAQPDLALQRRLALIGLLNYSGIRIEQLLELLPIVSQWPVVTRAFVQVLARRIAKRSRPTNRRQISWSFRRRRASPSIQWQSWLRRRQARALPDNLLPTLLELAQRPDTARGLREEVCHCLGLIADSEAVASLSTMLQRSQNDVGLSLAIAAALGRTRDIRAIPALSSLLDSRAFTRLRDCVPSSMLRESGLRCVSSPDLPRAMAARLELHLACALTEADKPSTLTEFLLSEAELLRSTAAQGLARIGGSAASQALEESLRSCTNGSSTRSLASALAACGHTGILALSRLLDDDLLPIDLRLVVAQAMAEHPDAEELAIRALNRPRLGGMLRGVLALDLGKRRTKSVGPILRLIVQDGYCEAYLRMQALQGLAYLGEAASENLLLQIIANVYENEHVRGAAAQALPATLSGTARHMLLSLLYEEQLPAALIIGALEALGRAGERELLTHTMRYCLDTRSAVVKAAIAAMTAIGDDCITPVLIRISQSPNADPLSRLSAIGSLLHFDPEAYASLVNSYLQSGQVLIQLQALEHMIAARVAPERLSKLLKQSDLVLAIRQRALTALALEPTGQSTIMDTLNDRSVPLALRSRAAAALGHIRAVQAISSLGNIATDSEEASALRLSCMTSLAAIDSGIAARTFSRLLEDKHKPGILTQEAERLLLHTLEKIYITGGLQ